MTGDGVAVAALQRSFIVHADEKLSAFAELERQVLTVTFYLESVDVDSCGDE